MILKRRVSLGGVQLDSLDERILITGIDEGAGKESITAVNNAAGTGQRVTAMRRDTLDVTVKFALNIKNDDMAARSELLEAVNTWAAPGGFLRLGHRPGRRLQVLLAQAPGAGDMFAWTNEYSLTFRAYSVPYWEDNTAVTVTSGTKSSDSMALIVPGNAQTVADVTVTNKSGKTINSVTLSVGGKQMVFSNLAMGGSATLTIDHPRSAKLIYMRARVGSTSVLAKRTGADDFRISPGANTITFSAERAVQVTVNVRGRYL